MSTTVFEHLLDALRVRSGLAFFWAAAGRAVCRACRVAFVSVSNRVGERPVPEANVELLKYVAVSAAVVAMPIGALAQSVGSSPPVSSSMADRTMVATIVRDSVGEVQLCELAISKSRNGEVLSFCRKTVNDHARIAISGMQLAQKIGATDAKLQPSPDTSVRLDTLSKKTDQDFDRSLMIQEIENHENEQDLLKYAADVADDVAVKRYEERLLSDVERFLGLAEVTLNTIGRP